MLSFAVLSRRNTAISTKITALSIASFVFVFSISSISERNLLASFDKLNSESSHLSNFIRVAASNNGIVSTNNNQTAQLWIGIKMDNLSTTLAQRLGVNDGAVVTEVKAGGPAENAGLRNPKLSVNSSTQMYEILDGDVILKVDNSTVHSTKDISSAIQTKKMGDNLTLTVFQDGRIKDLPLNPIPKPDFLVFKDPGRQYFVNYPSNWTAVNAESLQQLSQQSDSMHQLVPPEMIQRIEQFAATFVNPESIGTGITITKNPKISDIEFEKEAEEALAWTLLQENGTMIQDVECETYKVEANKACSYIVDTDDGLRFKIMQFLTTKGERSFVFTYSSFPENFDRYMPVVEKLLQSFNPINN